MTKKLKSGIIGQAYVIFGGAIGMSIGIVKDTDDKVIAVGMAELKHPVAKSGDPIIDYETCNGEQVKLIFPDFDSLNNFRNILCELEAEMKERIKKRDEQR